MRKLIFDMLVTLDGFYAGPQGEIDWHEDYVDQDHFRYSTELLARVDTLIFGRVTYELMAGYWPTAPADAIADAMNARHKLVFSRTLKEVRWQNSRLAQGEAGAEISRLKQVPGKDMVIFGSANLANTFLNLDLVDEFQIFVCPMFLGSGKSLFPGLLRRHKLKFMQTRPFASGMVGLILEPAR
ncbi:MAG TPA: dihydrofolate reductase family protein, partial [bacterium]|nr:dihydrofolate reductase family protein [bacterium]